MSQVDVIVVNHNGGTLLARAIDALRTQTYRDFRIILVDNASSDGSLDALAPGEIPLTIVRAPGNIGFAAANNLALRHHVRSEWVALLNPDAFPDPGWLDALMAAARDHSGFQAFGSCMRAHHDEAVLDGTGDVYHACGLYWREGHGSAASACPSGPREIFSPCAAAALYRASDLLEVGGFDESYFCYGEDVDIGFRLRLAGRRALFVPDATVVHVGSGLTGRDSDFALYHGHRNLVWNYVKNMPPLLFWTCLPAHLALNLATLLVFAARGRSRVVWRAKLDAVKGLPEAWRKRQAIQARRTASSGALWRAMCHGLPRRHRLR